MYKHLTTVNGKQGMLVILDKTMLKLKAMQSRIAWWTMLC